MSRASRRALWLAELEEEIDRTIAEEKAGGTVSISENDLFVILGIPHLLNVPFGADARYVIRYDFNEMIKKEKFANFVYAVKGELCGF